MFWTLLRHSLCHQAVAPDQHLLAEVFWGGEGRWAPMQSPKPGEVRSSQVATTEIT